jgi:hypothetical protein
MINPRGKIAHIFHRMDPVYENLNNATQITLPILFSGFFMLYTNLPFSINIMLLTGLIFPAILKLSTYKDRILNISVSFLLIILLQIVIYTFFNRPAILIVLVALIMLPALASIRFRSFLLSILFLIALFLNTKGGVQATINDVIGTIAGFGIVILSVLFFEYSLSIFRMRATLLNLLELISDAFDFTTVSEQETIANKYIYNLPFDHRAHYAVESSFNTQKQAFLHNVLTQINKSYKLLVFDEYYFEKNKKYKHMASAVFFTCKTIYRNITFLLAYKNYETIINQLLPDTDRLLEYITESFVIIHTAISLPDSVILIPDDSVANNWQTNYEKIRQTDIRIVDDNVPEIIYGLNCLANDIKKLRQLVLEQKP